MSILQNLTVLRTTVELTFDDRAGLRMRKSDWAALPLNVGDDVDMDAYIGRIGARQLAEGYEAALTLLDYSARTESEIRKKLSMKGYLVPVQDAILARLKDARLVDDAEFARRMTESAGAKKSGIYAVKRKLRAKGISEEDAEEALSSITDEDQLQAARAEAQRLFKKYADLSSREARAKLSQALARRGFGWNTISEALDGVGDDFDSDTP